MREIILTYVGLILCMGITRSQGVYTYQSKNGPINFTELTDEAVVQLIDSTDTIQIDETHLYALGSTPSIYTSDHWNLAYVEKMTVAKEIKVDEESIRFEPILINPIDGTRQVCDNKIFVRLQDSEFLDSIMLLSSEVQIEHIGVNVEDHSYLLYFRDINTQSVFSLVSKLNAKQQVISAEPIFHRMLMKQNGDPLLPDQWSIHNAGGDGTWTKDADMDVDSAWLFSTGLSITVAILDEGVDTTHLEFSSALVSGFDASGRGSRGHVDEHDSHGTACAGIIAARTNNVGIVGIAYDANIMPVRVAYTSNDRGEWFVNDIWIQRGIRHAWQNGADVLNCSWGGGAQSDILEYEIQNATSYGRGGHGCVIVFASGNSNLPRIDYPSSLDNVLSVGASTPCDSRVELLSSCGSYGDWGSNHGAGLDLVAPGVDILTTDNMGNVGYNAGDYVYFKGTSAACPHVAGVAALLLSINPALNFREVFEIILTTTDKVGDGFYFDTEQYGSWSNEMGYGRVNAYRAVIKAKYY